MEGRLTTRHIIPRVIAIMPFPMHFLLPYSLFEDHIDIDDGTQKWEEKTEFDKKASF